MQRNVKVGQRLSPNLEKYFGPIVKHKKVNSVALIGVPKLGVCIINKVKKDHGHLKIKGNF